MSGACFPLLRPQRRIFLASTAAPFAQQQLRSRDVAVARRPVQRRVASGGFFPGKPVGAALGFRRDEGEEADAPWEDDGSGGNAEL